MDEESTRQRIVILGGGGTALDFCEAALAAGHEVLGFLKDSRGEAEEQELLPTLGPFSAWKDLPETVQFFCGFGSVTSHRTRLDVLDRLGIPLYRFARIVHPQATVSPSAVLGPGSGVLAHATVGSRVRVGVHVEILQLCLVAHDCHLEDGVILAGGANLAGGTHVGRAAYIGGGACVRNGSRVGAGSLLGMNSTLLEDLPPDAVYAGSPARSVKKANSPA